MKKKQANNEYKGLSERQKNIVRLRNKLNQPDPHEVHPFSKYKLITYVFNIVFPPYALYRIWDKGSDFNNNEKGIQTAVCIIYMIILVSAVFNGSIL